MSMYRRLAACAALVVSGSLAACGEAELVEPSIQIQSVIAGVSTLDGSATGVLRQGLPPTATADAAPTVTGVPAAINGGSAAFKVERDGAYRTVYVALAGVNNYYELTLPADRTTEDVLLSIAPGVNGGSLPLRYAVAAGAGPSQYASLALRLIRVGTGDVQVSVAWTGASDVDLHVYDPAGEHIYFADKTSASGGQLDLDSNPACSIDNINNENVVWPTNGAPSGAYRVEVHYFADCSVARSDWVVTIQRRGQAPLVYSGSFVGASGAGNPPAVLPEFTY